MSWPWIAVLAAALVVVTAAEWPRISLLVGSDARRVRQRRRRKTALRVVRSDEPVQGDSDDFVESVRRDLDSLPTIEERDRSS